ncbi:MAG: ATPase, T2SS/T4P/T4SS family, partial [Planctomycetota bacterium]
MTPTLAQAVFLMSFVKPVLFLATAGGWAWVVAYLDKDAAFYYLKRSQFNLIQLAAAVLGFGAMLFIPIFWVGWPLGVLILAGGAAGYVVYRNGEVPEDERWTANLDSFRQRRAEAAEAKQQAKATLVIKRDGTAVPIPSPGEPALGPYMVLNDLMSFALPRNASQIDLSVDTERAKYRVHIDGVRYPQEAPEPAEAVKLVDYIKHVAGMDLEDRRRKQEARLSVTVENQGSHDIHVVSAGSTRGLQVQITFDPEATSNIPLDHLGLAPNQLVAVRELLAQKGKTILVASTTKQGKTTTLYSLLQEHDPYTTTVTTLEEEVLFELEGVDHTTLPRGKSAGEYNEKLGVILRGDPQVVMVSRLADDQTARLLAQAADETRAYVPLEQPDTYSALRAWMKQVGDARTVGEGLGAVIAQRLVRRLCHTCRVPYTP